MMLLGVLFCKSQTNGTWHVMYFDTRKDNGSCRIAKENPEGMPQRMTCIGKVGSEKAGKKERVSASQQLNEDQTNNHSNQGTPSIHLAATHYRGGSKGRQISHATNVKIANLVKVLNI